MLIKIKRPIKREEIFSIDLDLFIFIVLKNFCKDIIKYQINGVLPNREVFGVYYCEFIKINRRYFTKINKDLRRFLVFSLINRAWWAVMVYFMCLNYVFQSFIYLI